ncbi:N-acetylmuramoyl-L-alanine amidase [Bacteroides faecichinchillae]|uniref:N-acetylmuramoyl-L-alanine amidase n=1 Tax=Bacteroides faecichinchillae TaxID=871325 RepID=A0A1M5E3S0_9BACE|nr:N-acetylmuramoyl-L-alanine amidase [Bacteroides faecichinchillae]THG63978.1 N-acetylmuramoyl-L-alanine amidase [Bacteroides faecichinchillae]SHF73873.1 N-acetylmuramoyl-L-alanine amidase [Bacteroides faecichinchillae]
MKKRFYILLLFTCFFSVPTLWAQQKATPKAGEGISTFLLRHNRSPKKYYDDFVELNQKKLGKNKVLKMGVSYIIPPVKKSTASSTSVKATSENNTSSNNTNSDTALQSAKAAKIGVIKNEPLFGKALANVKVTSNRLAGACFYVVSGHGGPDPGAIGRVGRHELHEDEYAYDIALRLARNLMEEGAEVRIIIQDAKDGIRDDPYLSNSKRETCMGAPIPLNQVQRLQQRCSKINTLYQKDRKNYKYCRAIFIHVDSRSKGKQTDVFFYHTLQKPESKRLANNMKDMFEAKYDKHQPNRGFSGTVGGRNLYVLSHTTPASVFVELGNIQNTFDQRRLVMSSNRQALSKWLMEGFLKDYKAKK